MPETGSAPARLGVSSLGAPVRRDLEPKVTHFEVVLPEFRVGGLLDSAGMGLRRSDGTEETSAGVSVASGRSGRPVTPAVVRRSPGR